MKKLSPLLFLALMTVSSVTLASSINSMSKAEVEKTFIDKTFTSIAVSRLNSNPTDNTFVGTLDSKGNIMGKFVNKPSSAPQTDTGVYKINNDGSMYITWKNWEGGKEMCVKFYNTKNDYLAMGCDNEFHTAFPKNAFQSGDQLNSQK